MKPKSDFVVQIKSLLDGENLLEFKSSQWFFDEYCNENSDFKGGNIDVKVNLFRSSNVFTFKINIFGTLVAECDRCLDDIDVKINMNETIYAKIANDESDEDDYITILDDVQEIDLSLYIYEIISTNMPLRKVHEDGKCNPEMIKKLNSYLIDEEKEEKTDPRWDKLKDLLNN